MIRDHIPLGVGFYPEWFHKHYNISFGREYYFDPEVRIETRMEIEKRLYERFGDVGLGNQDPEPKPLITFGMVMLPTIFGDILSITPLLHHSITPDTMNLST